MKFSKEKVSYSKGKPHAHCGICRHFDADELACSLVAGRIEPQMWCELFSPLKDD